MARPSLQAPTPSKKEVLRKVCLVGSLSHNSLVGISPKATLSQKKATVSHVVKYFTISLQIEMNLLLPGTKDQSEGLGTGLCDPCVCCQGSF